MTRRSHTESAPSVPRGSIGNGNTRDRRAIERFCGNLEMTESQSVVELYEQLLAVLRDDDLTHQTLLKYLEQPAGSVRGPLSWCKKVAWRLKIDDHRYRSRHVDLDDIESGSAVLRQEPTQERRLCVRDRIERFLALDPAYAQHMTKHLPKG